MIDRPIPSDMKRCKGCGLVFELDAFYANPNYTDGRASKCKKCVAIQQKQRVARRSEAAEALRALEASAPPAVGNPSPLPVAVVGSTGVIRGEDARHVEAAPAEITQRLELATSILDQIANGRDNLLGAAIAQARQFVTIERGTGRYKRKTKP